MPFDPFSPQLTLLDMTSGNQLAQTTDIIDWQIQHVLDRAPILTIEVGYGTDAAAGLLAAETLGSVLADLSLGVWRDGPRERDIRRMVERPIRHIHGDSPTLIDSGEDIFAGYAVTGVDRVSFRLALVQDVLYGAELAIYPPHLLNSDRTAEVANDTGLLLGDGAALPHTKGLFRTIPGSPLWLTNRGNLVALVPFVDPAITAFTDPRFSEPGMRISVDEFANYLAQSLANICEKIGGVFIPHDAAPLGSRGHFVPDSSSAALNVTRQDNGIAVGKAGNRSNFNTFNFLQADGSGADVGLDAAIIEEMTITPELDALVAQAYFIGGQSNHGLPNGARITGMAVLHSPNKHGGQVGKPPAAWNAGLLVVSVYADTNTGGVYYYPGDGVFHPMSQNMGVTSLCFYEYTGMLFAGTDRGLYAQNPAGEGNQADWQLLGGFGGKISKVSATKASVDVDFNDAAIYILARGNSADLDGIYRYPAAGIDTGTNLGHDGMSRLHALGGVTDFALYNDSQLCFVCTAAPNTVYQVTRTGGSNASTRMVAAVVPNGSLNVEGLDESPIAGQPNVFVRTTAGSAGLFRTIPDSATMFSVGGNGGEQMLAPDGGSLHVNRIATVDGVFNGKYVGLIACTDQGIYQCDDLTGSTSAHWRRCDGQSGLGDQNIIDFNFGGTVQLLGRQDGKRVFANGGSSLHTSNDGGLHWRDALAVPLELGPFWWALAASGEVIGDYPDNTVVALGSDNLHDALDPVGTSILPITGPHTLPDGWRIDRRLDSQNNWVYRLVNTTSTSPYFGIHFDAVSEIATNGSVPVIDASEELAVVTFRWLAQWSQLQTTIVINWSMSDSKHLGRTLRPSDQVSLTCTVRYPQRLDPRNPSSPVDADHTAAALYDNVLFYVIEHTMKKGVGDEVLCQTKLGTLLMTQRQTPAEIAAGLQYGLQKVAGKKI